MNCLFNKKQRDRECKAGTEISSLLLVTSKSVFESLREAATTVPCWLPGQYTMKKGTIRRCYLHDSTADGRYWRQEPAALCLLYFKQTSLTDPFFRHSMFHATPLWRLEEMKHFSGLELRSYVWIWMCFFRCSDNSIRSLVRALRVLSSPRRLTSKAVWTLGGLDRGDEVERRRERQWWNIYQTWNPSSCCNADNRVCPLINP